jgi:hypothetical protein
VDVDVAVEAGPEDVLAEKAASVGFVDRPLEHVLDVEELAADVDVGDLRADGIAPDRAPFDQQVRVAFHQQVILERARLALVGVAGDVARLDLLVHELPLHAGRKSRAAAAAQARGLDDLDDFVRLLRQRRAQPVIALVRQIEIERERVRFADVRNEEWLQN